MPGRLCIMSIIIGRGRLLSIAFGGIIRDMRKTTPMLWLLLLLLTAILTGGIAGFAMFSVWDLPEVKLLEEYKPSITSRVYSDSNKLLAEFFLKIALPWIS